MVDIDTDQEYVITRIRGWIVHKPCMRVVTTPPGDSYTLAEIRDICERHVCRDRVEQNTSTSG